VGAAATHAAFHAAMSASARAAIVERRDPDIDVKR
jgi:hypothetical protein